MRRIRISYILPAILVFIGATIFVRSASLFQDMNHLVAGRKSHDAEVITRMVASISDPQVTDRDQQLVAMGRKLQHTHRSTRYACVIDISEKHVDFFEEYRHVFVACALRFW